MPPPKQIEKMAAAAARNAPAVRGTAPEQDCPRNTGRLGRNRLETFATPGSAAT
ncbi:hypothetical protein Bra471DRAFT_00846 [Bradyrhizobium sp. WSM471]|nr:hypothetical protein Bra471DRAFT_00846 [Bradyrhizobium sp. WSM471]